MLAGRRIVLGVSGGIAAYKSVELCRRLVDAGAHVTPVLTESALRFVGRTTFDALASERAIVSLWEGESRIPHTELGRHTDLVIVAPATARLLGALANGLSTDALTNVLIATRAPVVVCPAMHTEMWEHPAVVANVETLRSRGVTVVDPEAGRLAGGDVGMGRLAGIESIMAAVEVTLAGSGDLAGHRVVVTAGGTREPIDAVRVIANRSSGRQGHAIAAEAQRRGAEVVLITTAESSIPSGCSVVRVETAAEMGVALDNHAASASAVVMAAAVADFRPVEMTAGKHKKSLGAPEIRLEPTPDLLASLGENKPEGQVLVGFAAETSDLIDNARGKLAAKNLDLIVANDVAAPEVGFSHPTNSVTILDTEGGVEETGLMSKAEIATRVVDRVARLLTAVR